MWMGDRKPKPVRQTITCRLRPQGHEITSADGKPCRRRSLVATPGCACCCAASALVVRFIERKRRAQVGRHRVPASRRGGGCGSGRHHHHSDQKRLTALEACASSNRALATMTIRRFCSSVRCAQTPHLRGHCYGEKLEWLRDVITMENPLSNYARPHLRFVPPSRFEFCLQQATDSLVRLLSDDRFTLSRPCGWC